jgi:hypothetical protein
MVTIKRKTMSKRSFDSDDDDYDSSSMETDAEMEDLTSRLGKRMVFGRRTKEDVLKDCQDDVSGDPDDEGMTEEEREASVADCVANVATQEIFEPLSNRFEVEKDEQRRFVMKVLDDFVEDEEGRASIYGIKTLMSTVARHYPTRAIQWLKNLAEEDVEIADFIATVIFEDFPQYALTEFTGLKHPTNVAEAVAVLQALAERGVTRF